MKTNRSILALVAMTLFTVACKEKEILREDSPYITVTSPARDQAINDSDNIIVKAVIEPKNQSVVSYNVWLIDNKKNNIYNKKTDCDCKGKIKVEINTSFQYDINKTSDLLLHIDAVLEDGSNIREEIPFKLVDVKK
jgi:hypothetical protein